MPSPVTNFAVAAVAKTSTEKGKTNTPPTKKPLSQRTKRWILFISSIVVASGVTEFISKPSTNPWLVIIGGGFLLLLAGIMAIIDRRFIR